MDTRKSLGVSLPWTDPGGGERARRAQYLFQELGCESVLEWLAFAQKLLQRAVHPLGDQVAPVIEGSGWIEIGGHDVRVIECRELFAFPRELSESIALCIPANVGGSDRNDVFVVGIVTARSTTASTPKWVSRRRVAR